MNRQRRNYVRNIRLSLSRATALSVIHSLESSVESEPRGKRSVVGNPLPVTIIEQERLGLDAGRISQRRIKGKGST